MNKNHHASVRHLHVYGELLSRNHLYFTVLFLLGAVIYFPPFSSLVQLTFKNETYSHIMLIPVVSLFMLVIRRREVFAELTPNMFTGLAICAGGLALYAVGLTFNEQLNSPAFRSQEVSNDYLTFCMAGAVAWAIGSFIAVYGTQAFKKARFALLFLLFAVPLPMFLLNGVIKMLQLASAEAVDVIFTAIAVPYHRNGMVFEFTHVAIEVAEQCSGIRSSLALFILSVIVGHMSLRSIRSRAILAISVFPITISKNALRMATIALLANYVDLKFLTNHWIHSSGGIPFFAVALGLLIPVVWVLRRSEKKGELPISQP